MATLVIPKRAMVVNTPEQLTLTFFNSTTLVAVPSWGVNVTARMIGFADIAQADLISAVQVPYTAPVAHVVDITFPTAPLVGDEIIVNIMSRQLQHFGDDTSTIGDNNDKVHFKVETALTATQLRNAILALYNNKANINRKFTLASFGANTIRVTAKLGYELEPIVSGYAETITVVTPYNLGTGHYDVILPIISECNAMPYSDLHSQNNRPIKGRTYRTYHWKVRNLEEPNGVSIASQVATRELDYMLFVDTNLTTLITGLNTIV